MHDNLGEGRLPSEALRKIRNGGIPVELAADLRVNRERRIRVKCRSM
jgi:hypothetical protein